MVILNPLSYSFPKFKEVPTTLFIKLPSGEIIPFNDLSSGEQEAFFILCFFLRHDVNNAVIAIDEPELHLHPELSRQLIRTMLSIRPANQIWLATHNGEIIDEAGRDKVTYIMRDPKTREAVVIKGTDEPKSTLALKKLYGFSGFIGIAKNLVFLEGIDSSSDRKMYTRLFPSYGNQIKFIPSGSSNNLNRINTVILSMLDENFGMFNYYLIRDRDYLTPEAIAKLDKDSTGRIHVLERYHIENYLIDYDVIANVQSDTFGKTTTATEVRQKLIKIARNLTAEFVRDMIEFRLNLIYGPQDFSLGKYMQNQAILDTTGSIIVDILSKIENHILAKSGEINVQLQNSTDTSALKKMISSIVTDIQNAFSSDSEDWKILFPGKRILNQYAKEEGLGKEPMFINCLIKELASDQSKIPEELTMVIEKIGNNLKL